MISLRMVRREIESTLDAAFVGILSTDCEGMESNLHTELLTKIYLQSREKHFTRLFEIMLHRLQQGKPVGKSSTEYLQELNKEDINQYKFREM